jgi:hypothetical protein
MRACMHIEQGGVVFQAAYRFGAREVAAWIVIGIHLIWGLSLCRVVAGAVIAQVKLLQIVTGL